MSSNLKTKTILGFKWNFVNQFGLQFINLIFSIFLARLLGPTEFGLIAMVTVFTGFSNLFIDFGFGNALIHKENPSNTDWSSVFWLNVIFGAFICGILILFSGSIASFYDEPSLKNITIALAFSFIFSSSSIVYNAKLRKKMDFKSISLINLSSLIISGILGVVAALNGYGVWSLVIQRISNVLLKFILLQIVSRWIPIFKYSSTSIKEIASFSFYLFLGKTLNYGARNTDNLLIGKYLNSDDLGLYNRAYFFLMFPSKTITAVINSVLFPSLTQIKTDKERVKSIFIRSSKVATLMVCPLMLLFYLCSYEIVLILFGEEWLGMVPYMRLFSFLGVYQTLIGLNGPLYLAFGNMKLDFKIGLFSELIFIIAILIGINWGVYGVILGLYIASIINFFPTNFFIFKTIDLTILNYYKKLFPILVLNGVVFTIVLFLLGNLDFNVYLNFSTKVVAYFVLYLIGIKILKIEELGVFLKLLLNKK